MSLFAPLIVKKNPALEAARQEVRVSEACIPYAIQVDDYTIKTFEGHFIRVIRLGGFAFDTEDRSEINLRKRVRNQLWKSFNTSEVAVYHHIIRREREVLPEGEFAPGFAHDLDAAWKEQLRHKRQFTNELYLTVVHKQGEGAVRKLEHIIKALSHKADEAERRQYESRARKRLDNAVRTIMQTLKNYSPERLCMARDDSDASTPVEERPMYSEQMGFLGFLLNLKDRRYARPHKPIAQLLANSRPVFHHEIIELRHPTDTLYAGILSVKEYDDSTAANMMDKLLSLPIEFVMTQSFRFEERALSESEIERQQGRLEGTHDKGVSQIVALDDASEETKGEAGFGQHHMTILAWHRDPEMISHNIAAVDGVLAEQGITGVREDTNLEACFYAQLPGNFKYITRAARISSKNFASFASYHNYAHGRSRGHWGPAITVVQTESGTPHQFNLHVADRGNALGLGPTGQGKTLTFSFLFCQSLKLGGRRVFLDKDRGMEIFVRAVRGKYYRVESGKPTRWNPFKLPDSPKVRDFLCDLFEAILKDDGGDPINSDDRQKIKQVVAGVFDLDLAHRVLRHIAPMFGNPEKEKLAKRLLDWYTNPKYGEGRFAWIFDNEENTLDLDSETIGFDMTYILDNRHARTPVLLWMFFIVESLIDGKPMALFADEGWKLLDDDMVMDRIENFEFVIRKNNGLLAFATQTPETVLTSKIAPALKQQSETFVLFPNPKADEAVYCGYLGLNRKQFELIKRKLPERNEPGWFLVKNSAGAAVCRLDMTGMDDYIAVLSGNKNTIALLDELLAQYGEDPDAWLPHFYKRWRGYASAR